MPKIKPDFITNSSTTSYTMIGVELNIDKVKENEILIRKLFDNFMETCKNKELSFEDFKDDNGNIYEALYSIGSLHGIDIGEIPYDDIYLIGKDIQEMRDDQTLGDFKKEVTEILKDLGIEEKPGWIIESWRDG